MLSAKVRSLGQLERALAPVRPATHVMIFLVVMLLTVLGAPLAIMLFSPIFAVWDYLFVRHVRKLAAHPERVTWPRFALVLAHHGAVVGGFAILPVIVARLDWGAAAVIANVILVGQAFYNLAVEVRSKEAFLVTVAVLTVMAQIVFYLTCTHDLPVHLMTTLHVTVLALSVFGAYAGLQSNAMQNRLETLTAGLAAAQKGETVGRLTSGIAHDFRNLLTVMGGNLDLLQEVPQDEWPRLLNEIRDATNRGERLTARLLATARVAPHVQESIDLDAFLDRFIAFAERVIPANVVLRAGTVEPHLTIRTDPAELEAALLNVVLNARDAITGAGSIVIDAKAERDGTGASQAVLSVRDNGPGMSAEMVERAAEPFVSTKPASQGTGLGLAMVQAFAADTGGSLRIESAPGTGTTIRLNIPV
ncbi:MAG: ATP-binding protein [Pseudomonadota bacterium]